MPAPERRQGLTIWALWDAGELISVHLTNAEAKDAYEAHLGTYAPFAADEREPAIDAVELRIEDLAPRESLRPSADIHWSP